MGCVSSKEFKSDDHDESRRVKSNSKRFPGSSKGDEILLPDGNVSSSRYTRRERLVSDNLKDNDDPVPGLPRLLDAIEKKAQEVVDGTPRKNDTDKDNSNVIYEGKRDHRIYNVPNGSKRGHEAAGWPSWLTEVAKEAVEGWLPRREDSFRKLNKIGQGTYSNVYKARDLETGKIVALKKVRFANMDPESVRFMAREIFILRKLDHPNIVKLEGLVTSKGSSSLYLILEYMEHDLAGLAATPDIRFTEPQIKCYMQQLLSGLHHCHTRGVLHRDIKGSNLLIDNSGILKITDFGLATFFNPNLKQPLTSRVVTLWYRPPELLLGAVEYDASVDLWSTGCILAEMLVGKPILPGRTEVEQLHRIFKLCGSPSEAYWINSKLPHATIFKPQRSYPSRLRDLFRDFPSTTVDLLETLLAVEPEARKTAAYALQSEFFTTEPLACKPSSLPKYPPSKELDARLRDEEARRQKSATANANGQEVIVERELLPGPGANGVPMKQMQESKTVNANRNYHEGSGKGFMVHHPGRKMENGISKYSQTWNVKDYEPQKYPCRSSNIASRSSRPDFRAQMPYVSQIGRGALSNFSGPLGLRSGSVNFDTHHEPSKHRFRLEHRNEPGYQSHANVDRASSHIKNERPGSKESTSTSYNPKKNRIMYSGPLMPPGSNLDDMLKEHERQVQQAVRRSRIEKGKTKNHGGVALSQSILFGGRKG